MRTPIEPQAMTVWTRVYPRRQTSGKNSKQHKTLKRKQWKQPQLPVRYGGRALIFDTETRDESGQRLLLGRSRYATRADWSTERLSPATRSREGIVVS